MSLLSSMEHIKSLKFFRFQKIILVLFFGAILWTIFYAPDSTESISTFDSNIVVNPDSSFTVTETILYDFGDERKHGIYRNIRDKHPQKGSAWYLNRHIDLSLISVTMDGRHVSYTQPSYSGLSVKIGDPNQLITGHHTYVITYRVEGGLAQYDGETEVYWNVTGSEWEVPIQNVTASISYISADKLLPVPVCYVGHYGSTDSCQSVETSSNAVVFKQAHISPGEQLTVAQKLDFSGNNTVIERNDLLNVAGSVLFFVLFFIIVLNRKVQKVLLWAIISFLVFIFGIYTLSVVVSSFDSDSIPVNILVILSSFLLAVIGVYLWRIKYRVDTSVVVQYEPYKDLKPMFTGVLFDNKLDPRDITAAIVYLAQHGFLKIVRTTDKVLWVFDTSDYEITLLRSISEAETELEKEVLKLLFHYDALWTTVRLSSVTKGQARRRKNFIFLQKLKNNAAKDLERLGFLEEQTIRSTFLIPAMAISAFFLFKFLTGSSVGNETFIAFVFLLLFIFIFTLSGQKRRTKQGYEALNHLKGFKDYLSTTEKERYKFHNAPALNPQQYMEYLPYAIAFGVEEEWAKAFGDMDISVPDWYQDNSFGSEFSSSGFSTSSFSAGISTFTSAFNASATVSGSSGGGHSGGGGGGGGGGSW
jgi:uncharacterized membrane protein